MVSWRGTPMHLRLKGLRLTLADLDALDPTQFELAVRDLMIRDGITARHVGQRGDQAADAVGEDTAGRRYVAQCKHTTVASRVVSRTMYEVKGTAGPVHGADIAFVVTNGGFTRDAKTWGETNHVHWLDRDKLRQWAEHGTSLHNCCASPPAPAPGCAVNRRSSGRQDPFPPSHCPARYRR